MTAKEKAIELYHKILLRVSPNTIVTKGCIYILIEEVQGAILKGGEHYEFWEEVKKEVEEL